MNTVEVTFAADYLPGLDTLYTYETDYQFKPGEIGYIVQGGEIKKARVINVHKKYNTAAKERFGSLEVIYGSEELAQQAIVEEDRVARL